MLKDHPVHPSLACRDVDAARDWYRDKLGFEPELDDDGLLVFRIGAGRLSVYESASAGTAQNTVALWRVHGLRAFMATVRGRGVAFEDYDFEVAKTVDGVMEDPEGGILAAWFKDGDGNIIGLVDDPADPRPEGISAMLAAADLERAKQWYSARLGLEPSGELPDARVATYETGDTTFTLYETQYAGTARNTVAIWRVADLRREAAELRSRGVRFEDYDFGDERTVDGILENAHGLNAWFTDSEGNILGLAEERDA